MEPTVASLTSTLFRPSNFVKTGNPNGEGLEKWDVCSADTDGSFMWWTNGTSKYVKNADPEREKINKEVMPDFTFHLLTFSLIYFNK